MHDVYRELLFIRLTGAAMAIAATAVAPIGAILALAPAPPAALNQFYFSLLVGGLLALFFIYLAIRFLRYGLVVTPQDVKLRGLLWTTRIPMQEIHSVEQEDVMSDGSWESVFVARDVHEKRLFAKALPRATEIVDRIFAARSNQRV